MVERESNRKFKRHQIKRINWDQINVYMCKMPSDNNRNSKRKESGVCWIIQTPELQSSRGGRDYRKLCSAKRKLE